MKAKARLRFIGERHSVKKGDSLVAPIEWRDKPEGENWFLVVRFLEDSSWMGKALAIIEFQSPKGPGHLLKPGFHFTLKAGPRVQALGEVTAQLPFSEGVR